MSIFEITIIALGLAMDAFAVAVANGAVIKQASHKHALLFGGYFGIFQAAMTLLGWLTGTAFSRYCEAWGHWVAFALLAVIGVNMIFEGCAKKDAAICKSEKQILCFANMAMLGVATSVDAFMAGAGMAMIKVRIVAPALIIGVTAFILPYIGVMLGSRLNKVLKNYSGIAGGIILLAIGLKILIEGLV